MSTYGTMITRIGTELRRGTSIDSQIRSAIQSAIDYYRAKWFGFNTARVTTSTVVDQPRYPFPSFTAGSALEISGIRITENSRTYSIDEISGLEMQQRQHGSEYTGLPCKWAQEHNEIWLDPIPDDIYTMEATVLYDLTELSATSDTNAWMTEAEELIRLHAKIDLLQNVIRGPEAFQEAAQLQGREQMIYQQLKRTYDKRRHSGTLAPSEVY